MRSATGVVLVLLSAGSLVGWTGASVPVQLLPFINYYEVYLEPYTNLTYKIRGPNSYTATLAMLGLVAAGTLGYLPVNLKDVAGVIDRKLKSGRRQRRRHGPPGLSRRRGWHGPLRRRRWRRAVADPDTIRQALRALDGDGCLARLVCEAEFAGPSAASSAEERLIHQIFRSGVLRGVGLEWLEMAAHWGRASRRRGSPASACGLLSPRCRHSPLEDLRALHQPGDGHLAGSAETLQFTSHSKDGATSVTAAR